MKNFFKKNSSPQFWMLLSALFVSVLILLLGYAESLGSYKEVFLISLILFTYGLYEFDKKFFEFKRNMLVLQAELYLAQKGKNFILSKGKDGEDRALGVIANLREKMNFIHKENSWMPIDSGIEEIVILNSEKSISQEVDGLIVTGNIVFLIEIKNWWGNICIKNGSLYRNDEILKSPETQTQSKIEKLDALINHIKSEANNNQLEDLDIATIVPVYLFPNKDVNLDPNLPHNYIKLEALSSFIAYYRDHHLRSVPNNLQYIKKCIIDVLDKDSNQKENHLLRIAKYSKYPSQDIVNFKNLHDEIIIKQGELNVNSIKNTFKTRLDNSRLGLYLILQFVVIVGAIKLLK